MKDRCTSVNQSIYNHQLHAGVLLCAQGVVGNVSNSRCALCEHICKMKKIHKRLTVHIKRDHKIGQPVTRVK